MWASKTMIKIYKINVLFSFLCTIWIRPECGFVHCTYDILSLKLVRKNHVSRFFSFTQLLTLAARAVRNRGNIKIIVHIFMGG